MYPSRRAGCFIRKLEYHLQSEFCGHTSTWGTVHKEAGIRSTAVRWLASTSDFWAKQRALQGSSRGDFKASRRNDSVLAVPATNSQVHVFWDIDNKTAVMTRPEDLVANIFAALQPLGEIAGICAYGNRHTFSWVPPVERARRREIKESWRQQPTSKSGTPIELQCTICGAKARTPEKLEAHFRKLHKREMMKPSAHQRSFQKWKIAHQASLNRYNEMHDALHFPKRGYGLRRILMESGILVKEVADVPQAADEALKGDVKELLRHMQDHIAEADEHQQANAFQLGTEGAGETAASSTDQKWPLDHFLEKEMRLEPSSTIRHSVTLIGEYVAQRVPQNNVICIISNDLGFDKLLSVCKRAGCRTVAMSDLTINTYKHADVLLSWEMAESGLY